MLARSYKAKQIFFLMIKLSIVVGAFYYIYQNLSDNEHLKFNDFVDFLIKNDAFLIKNMIILLFLSIFNWIFEILKWQNLVSVVLPIRYFEALKQSLAALTASLITPNRIGDYAAKAVYYDRTKRKHILLLNLLSNMAQMLSTVVFGIAGLSLFVKQYNIVIPHDKLLRGLTLVVIIMLAGYYTIGQQNFSIRGFNWFKIYEFTKSMPSKIHVKNIVYSVIRYLIFSFQFYFLLRIFGVDVSYYNAMLLISSTYLLSSLVPAFTFFDVVIKGSVAVYLFGMVQVNAMTILSVTTTMWLLNFILPSLVGSFFVLKFKWKHSYPSNSQAS